MGPGESFQMLLVIFISYKDLDSDNDNDLSMMITKIQLEQRRFQHYCNHITILARHKKSFVATASPVDDIHFLSMDIYTR